MVTDFVAISTSSPLLFFDMSHVEIINDEKSPPLFLNM